MKAAGSTVLLAPIHQTIQCHIILYSPPWEPQITFARIADHISSVMNDPYFSNHGSYHRISYCDRAYSNSPHFLKHKCGHLCLFLPQTSGILCKQPHWHLVPVRASTCTFILTALSVTRTPRRWQWWLVLGLTWGAMGWLVEMWATPENPAVSHGDSPFLLVFLHHLSSLRKAEAPHLPIVCSACDMKQCHSLCQKPTHESQITLPQIKIIHWILQHCQH